MTALKAGRNSPDAREWQKGKEQGPKQRPVTQGGAEAQGSQFVYQMLWDDGVKRWTEVQEQHPHMSVFLLHFVVRNVGLISILKL